MTTSEPHMKEASKAFGLIHRPGKVVEVRAIYRDGRAPWIGSFNERKPLMEYIADASSMTEIARVQWSLNTARSDWEVRNVLERNKNALSKVDIVQRDWLFLDFDRAPGFSAMDEADIAHVLSYLHTFGVTTPLLVSSGRGLNALFKAEWTIEGEPDFHALCRGLADKFNDEYMTVDDATSFERGSKIPGTLARKGDDPSTWRPVYILSPEPEQVQTPQSSWQRVIEDLRSNGHIKKPTPPPNGRGAPIDERFDIYEFCEAYGIEILKEEGDRFDVVCPLKGARHSGGTSVTSFFYNGSRLGFKCMHPDHDDVTIGKLVSFLQQEFGTYQLPLFAARDTINVDDVSDSFLYQQD